jgi:hypothetical protein
MTPQELEIAVWENISTEYLSHGDFTTGGEARFDVLVFWTHSFISSKIRGRARFFASVFAAINHEATSESTSAGHAFNKQRTRLASGQLCGSVVCASGEKLLCRTASAETRDTYKARPRARPAAGGGGGGVALLAESPRWG